MKPLPLAAGVLLSCLCLGAVRGWASPGLAVDRNGDGRPDQWYELADGRVASLTLDRNYDDRVDYAVEFDAQERKVSEQLDFNFDGRMDDFYYFEKGGLIRQEIDTNFDERIDVWVYLEGQYIRRYEMDKDFDGVAEVKKEFGP